MKQEKLRELWKIIVAVSVQDSFFDWLYQHKLQDWSLLIPFLGQINDQFRINFYIMFTDCKNTANLVFLIRNTCLYLEFLQYFIDNESNSKLPWKKSLIIIPPLSTVAWPKSWGTSQILREGSCRASEAHADVPSLEC